MSLSSLRPPSSTNTGVQMPGDADRGQTQLAQDQIPALAITAKEFPISNQEQLQLAQALHVSLSKLDPNLMKYVIADNQDPKYVKIIQDSNGNLGANGEVLQGGFATSAGSVVFPQNIALGAARHGLNVEAATKFIAIHEIAGALFDSLHPLTSRAQRELAQQVVGNVASTDWRLAHAMDMITTMRYFRDPAASPEYQLVGETMMKSFDTALKHAGVTPTADTFDKWVMQYKAAIAAGGNNSDAMSSAYQSLGIPENQVVNTIREVNYGFVMGAQAIVNRL
jgi:hypothetical protein